MPPKKTLKTIAAEKKKKNTAEAENIIATLMLDTEKSSRNSTVKPKKSSKEKTEKVIAAESKKNDTGIPKELVSKSESSTHGASKDKDIPTTSDNAVPMETNFDSSSADGPSAIDHSRGIGRAKSVSTSQRPKSVKSSVSTSKASKPSVSAVKASKPENPTSKDGVVPMETNFDSASAGGALAIDYSRGIGRDKSVSTSQRPKSVSSSKVSKPSYAATKAKALSRNSKIGDYQYEIDCQKVAEDIDVKNLQRYLEENLKVNGKKKNLDGTISVHCKGNAAVIKSNTFIPKKSLRYLSRNFLKRNWNIRVVSKNVHSYEYKYIGSL